MLSLNLPQILILTHAYYPRERRRIKRRPALPKKDGLKSGGTMPKSHPRRNAAGRPNGRF
jgi:hypothetical protein